MKKPPRIILCRHAESIEDVDNTVYEILEDLQIPLTKKGSHQAHDFGTVLAQLVKHSSHVRFYTSPGVRNVQTLKIVLPMLSDNISLHIETEPLIVKQDWGKFDLKDRPAIEADRYKTGVLRYTFPQGESAKSMIRRLKKFRRKIIKVQKNTGHDIVVFSHGFEFRVLLMLMLGWTEKEFESFGNLRNCEYRILTRRASGVYTLNKPLKKHGRPITRLAGRT